MVAKEFSVKDFGNMDDLISISDAVHIVTPTNFHHEIAIKCLQKNKDIFIEKPITSNTAQANEIIELALSRKCIVQVGHIERFNPTINRLKDIEALVPKNCILSYIPFLYKYTVYTFSQILPCISIAHSTVLISKVLQLLCCARSAPANDHINAVKGKGRITAPTDSALI